MNQAIQKTSVYKSMWKSKNVSKYLLRLILRTLLITVITIFFGFGLMFIALGVILCSLAWAPVWRPAFILLAKLVSLEEPDVSFTALKLHWWQVIYLVIRGAIPGVLAIGAGIWLIIQDGFCGQNFFC